MHSQVPYRLTREDAPNGRIARYKFIIVHYQQGPVAEAFGNSPIAPQWMRDKLATLNTAAVLNKGL